MQEIGELHGMWSRIHYLEAGKGPAILFVQGWVIPGWIWEKQIAHFAKRHRVVAMDPRSTGESSQTAEGLYPAAQARDIQAVVDQLKLAPVVLVGLSMGANYLAAYVDQFGTDTLARLVFVDGWAGRDYDPNILPKMWQWIPDDCPGVRPCASNPQPQRLHAYPLTPNPQPVLLSALVEEVSHGG